MAHLRHPDPADAHRHAVPGDAADIVVTHADQGFADAHDAAGDDWDVHLARSASMASATS